MMKAITLLIATMFLTGCQSEQVTPYDFALACESIPNEENAKLRLSEASDGRPWGVCD